MKQLDFGIDPWEAPVVKGRKMHFNPRPPVPVTGWKRPTFFPDLTDCDAVCWDFEAKDENLLTHGPGWGRDDGHPVGLAVSTTDGFTAYYPFAHEDEEQDNFRVKDVRDWAADQHRRRAHKRKDVFWNAGYDCGWFLEWGIEVAGQIYDGWIAEKLLLCSTSRQKKQNGASLEESGQRHVGKGKRSIELLRWIHKYFGRGPAEDEDLDDALKAFIYRTPPRLCGPYAESDTTLPLEIGLVQMKLLQDRGMWDLFRMECDLVRVFDRIRFDGVTVNKQAAEVADREIGLEIRTLHSEVNHIAGCSLEINGNDRIGQVLHERGHKIPRTAKSNKWSVTSELLKGIDDPLAEKLIELKELDKFRSTFIQGHVLSNITAKGRIHGSLKQFGTITGRLSQEKPNLQQIPSRNERLTSIVRAIFIPDVGHSHWHKKDYSQLQCRILAHYATGRGSNELRQEYNEKPETNYHLFTHDLIQRTTGIDLKHKSVKNTNFAIIFGAGQPKIARMIRLPQAETEPFFTAYNSGLPYVRDTLDSLGREANQIGFSRTILNRQVIFDLWEEKFSRRGDERISLPLDQAVKRWGPNIQRAYLHKVANFTIQGSEADLAKMALWKAWKDGIFDVIGYPKLLVHDEGDWSVPDRSPATLEGLAEMTRIMETAVKFKVPILVSESEGANWGEAK